MSEGVQDSMTSDAESAEERKERITRRRDVAIARVSMSSGQAATLREVPTRPSPWVLFALARR